MDRKSVVGKAKKSVERREHYWERKMVE
jgi:hypothetical protein